MLEVGGGEPVDEVDAGAEQHAVGAGEHGLDVDHLLDLGRVGELVEHRVQHPRLGRAAHEQVLVGAPEDRGHPREQQADQQRRGAVEHRGAGELVQAHPGERGEQAEQL